MESDKRHIVFVVLAAVLAGAVGGGIAGAVVTTPGNEILPWIQKTVLNTATENDNISRTVRVEEESATISAVRRVSPSVVSIIISKEVSFNTTGELFPFDEFFGFPFEERPTTPNGEKREVGGGTGFIIGSDGLILTNRHVVDDPDAEYKVVLADGREFQGTVVGVDPIIDLGLIKIDIQGLPPVELGDSDSLQIGETVIAIGNTLSELPNTVTKGVVSGLARRIVAGDGAGRSEVIEEAIQTDAAINPGNSGGPLVNLSGHVIGLNVAVSRPAQGVGFAIPINTATASIKSFRESGKIVRPWLGVRYVLLTPEAAKANNLPVDYGALIASGGGASEPAVVAGSPAEAAGLRGGDIILEIDGKRIDEDETLASAIARKKTGDAVVLKIRRGDAELTIQATLGEYPTDGVE